MSTTRSVSWAEKWLRSRAIYGKIKKQYFGRRGGFILASAQNTIVNDLNADPMLVYEVIRDNV